MISKDEPNTEIESNVNEEQVEETEQRYTQEESQKKTENTITIGGIETT